MRTKDKMLKDCYTVQRVYPDGMAIVQLATDVISLMEELKQLRIALTYFLSEDWSHITDANTLREIAEDVARKDNRKWDALSAELKAQNEEIKRLTADLAQSHAAVEKLSRGICNP